MKKLNKIMKLILVSSISAIFGCFYFLLNLNDTNFGVVFWLFAWMILYVPLVTDMLSKDINSSNRSKDIKQEE